MVPHCCGMARWQHGYIVGALIADGQLVENWGEVDMLGLLQQLGAIPMPGQAG